MVETSAEEVDWGLDCMMFLLEDLEKRNQVSTERTRFRVLFWLNKNIKDCFTWLEMVFLPLSSNGNIKGSRQCQIHFPIRRSFHVLCVGTCVVTWVISEGHHDVRISNLPGIGAGHDDIVRALGRIGEDAAMAQAGCNQFQHVTTRLWITSLLTPLSNTSSTC